jgi:uncharacterized membrane protein
MRTKKFFHFSTIICLVVLFGVSFAWPPSLLAAPVGEKNPGDQPGGGDWAQIDASIGASPGIPSSDRYVSGYEGEPQPEWLLLISEMTGYRAVETPISEDCTYDLGYEVYLCEESGGTTALKADPAAQAQAMRMLNATGLLLIPDSAGKRIMAFDPISGDLIDSNFIILEDEPTGTIIHAILGSDGESFLISDQTRDVVHQYDLSGNYMGVFAPAGGANPDIIDNIRGIALRPNDHLLVTVGAGSNANAIAEFDTAGVFQGNFVDNGSGGLNSPFDIYQRPAIDWLVGGITSDAIHRYHLDTGEYLDDLAPIDTFPEQIYQAANSNILIANFSGTQAGVVELTTDGELVGIYNPAELSYYRGVYELPNGNLLTTTGDGVFEINREGQLVETKISGVTGRYIEFVQVEIPQINLVKTVGLEPGVCAETDEIVVPEGTEVTYCFTVSNIGDIDFTLHDLEDSHLGLILDGFEYLLAQGESHFLTYAATIEVDTTNTATWTAYNPGQSDVATATDSATVYMLFYDLELTPEELALSGDPGETVEYTLTLTNTGNGSDAFTVEAGDSEWDVALSETYFELEPGEGAEVVVQVDVPIEAMAGDQDTVIITATSENDESVTASSTLTTTANAIYNLMLEPDEIAATGDPGETVEYTLTLTNTGNGPDTIELEAGESEWDVTLPETSFTLEPGEAVEVNVLVEISVDALAGDQDTVIISATSTNDESVTASSTLTTTANAVYGLTLDPEEVSLSGDPGVTVEYTLTLTNAGNITDAFTVEAGESEWDVRLSETYLELDPGEMVEVSVQVDVPIEAMAGDQDTVMITATSTGDDNLTAFSTLTTIANAVYGLALEPEEASLTGIPGETVEYNLMLTNIGNTADTFTAEAGDSEWEVQLPESSFGLDVGESIEIKVHVTIPVGAKDGDSDLVIITITSVGNSQASAASELTTTVEIEGYWLFLPTLLRDAAP